MPAPLTTKYPRMRCNMPVQLLEPLSTQAKWLEMAEYAERLLQEHGHADYQLVIRPATATELQDMDIAAGEDMKMHFDQADCRLELAIAGPGSSTWTPPWDEISPRTFAENWVDQLEEAVTGNASEPDNFSLDRRFRAIENGKRSELATRYRIVPATDVRNVVAQIDIYPAEVPHQRGAAIELLLVDERLDRLLEPPAGWHWYTDESIPGKRTLSFNPNADDLVQAALWELNHPCTVFYWDATRLTSELHGRSAGSIVRYVENALADLDNLEDAGSE